MEPMDLDHHDNLSYRSNPQASTSPPLSPSGGYLTKRDLSDMEIDPNSPPPPPSLSSYSNSNTDRHGNIRNKSNVVISPSLEFMNQSLSSILSLNFPSSNNDSERCDLRTSQLRRQQQQRRNESESESPPRACHSAPPVSVSPYFRSTTPADPKSDVNVPARELERPRTSLAAVMSGLSHFTAPKSNSKIGYGIRDDEDECDGLFSRDPLPVSGNKNSASVLRNRVVRKSNSMPSSSTDAAQPCVSNDVFDNKLKSKARGRCSKFLKALLVFIFFFIAMFVLYTQSFVLPKSCDDSDKFFQNEVLEVDLKTDLFGQHIASELIQNRIMQYFDYYRSHDSNSSSSSTSEKPKHCKPLVLAFHGWTGVGKNFGSQIISQSFTRVVTHPFIVPLLFPHKDQQEVYAHQIHDWITSNISSCSVNLFVIDEMDKAFPGVQKGLLRAVQTLTSSCASSSSSSPVIFILISNTHAVAINKVFVETFTNSPLSIHGRTDLKMEHFQSIFDSASNSNPEWYSYFSTQGVIDAFVPFLPLEKIHVIECIKRELVKKHLSTDGHVISHVLKELSFSVHGDLELSTTGCKRVADKVNYVIYNMK